MAIIEILEARETGKSAERVFMATEYASNSDARAAVLASVPTSHNGFGRVDDECDVREVAASAFTVTCVYRSDDTQPKPVDSFTVSVDISGQSTRITQAYKHVGHYAAAGKTPRNFRGAINVTSDGVDGTDVIVPAINYTVHYVFDSNDIDDDYVREVAEIVGCQNKRRFRTWEPGELLLTRVSGQQRPRDEGKTDVSFGFAASRNKKNLKIDGADGVITVPAKRGWDYLWTYREERTVDYGGGKKYTHVTPVSAHVEQVYKDADFDDLRI